MCAELQRFEQWAAGAVEEASWLEMPEGVFLLGDYELGRRLYVREAYRKLADVLEMERAEGRVHAVISGILGSARAILQSGCL